MSVTPGSLHCHSHQLRCVDLYAGLVEHKRFRITGQRCQSHLHDTEIEGSDTRSMYQAVGASRSPRQRRPTTT